MIRRLLLMSTVLAGGLALGSTGLLQTAQAAQCTPPHRLNIIDLDMVPDPIPPGKKVEKWQVTIQSDRNGECSTIIKIYDENEVAGQAEIRQMRPGRATYELRAMPDYRFRRDDSCFVVQAEMAGNFIALDSQRRFCARAKKVWSLKE